MNGGIKMLWTEKYRPNRIEDLIGQEHFRLDAISWVEENNMPNVLAYGNPGNGKTAGMIALAKSILKDSFEDNFFEVNASDDRRLETVRTTIKNIAQSGVMGDAPFRIMLLDEMDGMTTDAQNALKRIMERYSSNIRFMITCNDQTKIIFALQSRCANYHFSPLSNEHILGVINSILEAEGITRFSQDELSEFIASTSLDLRRAITEIQAAKSSNGTLKAQITMSLEDYSKALELLNTNKTQALAHIQGLYVSGKTMKEICSGLHDATLNTEMEAKMKFKFLRTIGEAEWRSSTMTPKVLISWMVGQL